MQMPNARSTTISRSLAACLRSSHALQLLPSGGRAFDLRSCSYKHWKQVSGLVCVDCFLRDDFSAILEYEVKRTLSGIVHL